MPTVMLLSFSYFFLLVFEIFSTDEQLCSIPISFKNETTISFFHPAYLLGIFLLSSPDDKSSIVKTSTSFRVFDGLMYFAAL